MPSFDDPNYLYLLIIVPFLYIFVRSKLSGKRFFTKEVLEKILVKNYGLRRKTRVILALFAISFIIIAVAKPIIKGEEIELENDKMDVVVAIDISKSMRVDDIFPSRFEFAKNKFNSFLSSAIDKRVGVIAFASSSYMISPISSDLGSLKYLVDNLAFENFTLKGTSVMSALEATNSLSSDTTKTLLLFSDGGDKESFKDEIAYAKANGITVYLYLTATKKGKLFKTPDGDMTLLRANREITVLADATGGVVMESSVGDDMKRLNEIMSAKKPKKDSTTTLVVGQKELFYYPLALGVLLFFISNFSLPSRKKI